MTTTVRRAAIIAALLLLPACRSDRASNEVPARLVDPTPETRAELSRVVAQALGTAVALRDDALTRQSVLLIERSPHQDLAHGRILGRDLGTPERFQLVKHSGKCVLVRVSTGERWTLEEARCVEE